MGSNSETVLVHVPDELQLAKRRCSSCPVSQQQTSAVTSPSFIFLARLPEQDSSTLTSFTCCSFSASSVESYFSHSLTVAESKVQALIFFYPLFTPLILSINLMTFNATYMPKSPDFYLHPYHIPVL